MELTLVGRTKTRRERALPLTEEVGAALAEYVLHERPQLRLPHVFLSSRAPRGPVTPRAIGDIVGRKLRRAGIQAPSYGAHVLRHSLATRLVNEGVSIKQIANLLGHTSIDTTAIYAKVDTATLGGKPPCPDLSSNLSRERLTGALMSVATSTGPVDEP
ncbi:MAG: hypothetical protein BMS9Abin37_2855 [Acidobacteriota bacterium]|nr:MAG: hypothetical protein BMS9Abin37_2855 [Acidobacteriota bacterium]